MKILIVDDHALFREGLSYVLRRLEDDVVLLEAPDYECALQHISADPDMSLVLLDLNIPGRDGFATLDALTAQFPTIPIVVLSAYNQRNVIMRCLNAGALGFIPKDTTSHIMLGALRTILSGGVYVPPCVMQQRHFATQGVANDPVELTPRQQQVLALLIRGYSNKKIASEMALAESTVKMHVTSILKSLNVNNRTQAAMAAEKLGLCIASLQFAS